MNFRKRMAHALREPLFHFLIVGGVFFVAYSWSGSAVDAESRRIVVDEGQVERLVSMWSQTWRRPPNAQELDALVRDYIKEEVYYREAKRLGLDEDDIVVRRRLRSKMEFLATSAVENAAPTDAVLQAWLDKYPDRYATDPVISFETVYIDAQSEVAESRLKAARMLEELRAGRDPAQLGDPISLPRSMISASQLSIRQQFGDAFAIALKLLPQGQWSGPVSSGFGLHLVRVKAVEQSRQASLSEVRQRVENDWRAATKERRESAAYQALLDGYAIEIERPK